MAGFIDMTAEDLGYLPKDANVAAGCMGYRFQEVDDNMAYFYMGDRGGYAAIVPLKSIHKGEIKLLAGDPDVVESNLRAMKEGLRTVHESIGSREVDQTAYNARIDITDGRIFRVDNHGTEPIAAFVCDEGGTELRPSRVKNILISNYFTGETHVPIQEARIPKEARRNLFETAYWLNRYLEEMGREDLERLKRRKNNNGD